MNLTRWTRWTAADHAMLPWLRCDYIDYSANDYEMRVYRGQRYAVRRTCGKPVLWIGEIGTTVVRRCQEHRNS